MAYRSPNDIAAEIAKLSCLSVTDLRAEWSRVIGDDPPRNTQREYLLRAIAHHLQCECYGDLPAHLRRSLLKLSQNPQSNTSAAPLPTRTLKPGARILREWKGTVHEIEVVEAGYRYGAQTYKSLSVIARQITGTRWSGPAFFGLKQSQPEASRGL